MKASIRPTIQPIKFEKKGTEESYPTDPIIPEPLLNIPNSPIAALDAD